MPAFDSINQPAPENSNPLNPRGQSDEQQALWTRFRAGDHQAFDTLMTTHYRTLFRYGSRFSTDPEFIKDTIQDLFLYLWERRTSLHPVVATRPYLLVSLRRLMRRKQTAGPPGGNAMEEQGIDETEAAFHLEFSVEQRFIENEVVEQRAAQLKTLLNALPARQQEVVYLRFFQELTRDQIAQVMTITPQTVSNLLQLAFRQLRQSRGIEWLLPILWLMTN
jgi:RNA polymerase sigma factor (sigma-70 family)